MLSVMRVGSFEEALDVANSSVYKLTGGVFSRKPAHLEAARREFRVGNLYLEPRHHRRAGRPAAVRRLRPLRRGQQGRRGRLPAPLRRAPLLHGEHHAPRLRAGVGIGDTPERSWG